MKRRSANATAIALALVFGAFASAAFAQSPVADAAMRRDNAEVSRLVQSGADA
jgi:hypothetical protein